jgi:Copper type II ascorbate-dependent monooxygenase, C-terminal domain
MHTIRLLVVLAFGCGTSSETARSPLTFQLSASVAPGAEIYRCRYFVLPDETLEVDRFTHRYTPGSHHILLYPTSLSASDVDGADFDCTTVGDLHQTGLLYGADDKPSGVQDFPEGVGFRFAPRQVVLLEAHYLNATDATLQVDVEVEMRPARAKLETLAGNLFFYNYAVLLPPAPGRATSAMRCEIPAKIELAFASSHMHKRGTHYLATLETDGDDTVVHESYDWQSAEPTAYVPTLPIDAGDSIEFRCDYMNDRGEYVVEGESAERDEMCMFIASYWPQMSPEAEACAMPGSMPLLDGAAACTETLACTEVATDAVGVQQCLANTCRGSAAALHTFLMCGEAAGCTTDTCLAQYCGAEYVACEQASCP